MPRRKTMTDILTGLRLIPQSLHGRIGDVGTSGGSMFLRLLSRGMVRNALFWSFLLYTKSMNNLPPDHELSGPEVLGVLHMRSCAPKMTPLNRIDFR